MNRQPLIEEVLTPLTAAELFQVIKDRRYSFFLDSGMDPRKLGRYSFVGCDPFLVLSSLGRQVRLSSGEGQEVRDGNPFDVLGELLARYQIPREFCPVPFIGGAVGYLSYDLCHFIERLPATAVDDLRLPEAYFAFYDCVVAFDHLEGRVYLLSTGFPEQEEAARLRRAADRLVGMKDWLAAAAAAEPDAAPAQERADDILLRSNFTREEYVAAVQKVRDYIVAGDVFQVNISQRFEANLPVPPYELYRRLREINPAPFASYLNFDDLTVVSASPERFLRVQGDLVETRPVKGTRPRGRTPAEDEALGEELLASIKDRAENVMIVDLERNDLGRVCRYGTVKVTELVILEAFPTVFHLTSTVTGRLSPGRGIVDLLKGTFPGGSITGAPKVRAMEIIDELEPTRRSVYTGSIGYIGFNLDMDINIVIRTMLVKDGRVYFQVGGGVIYDSDPEAEYEETMDKGRALIQALQLGSAVVVEAT